jgi:hypothetical protein
MSVSELTLLVLRLGFLLVLWLFIFGIVYALRSDLFGQRARKMQADVAGSAGAPAAFPSATPVPSATQPPAAAASAPTEQFTARPGPAFTSGPKSGTEFPLTGDSITIGRSGDSSLVIRDDYTSTHHARLMLWHDKWMIQDLDSTNGTFLDGNRLAVPTPVPLNTTVKIGATSFELRR